jgi:hypothetical protein
MSKKLTPIDNNWHVTIDTDFGARICFPWLTKDHAERLAALMNEIEDARIERRGGSRERGDGDFYGIKEEPKKWMAYGKED